LKSLRSCRPRQPREPLDSLRAGRSGGTLEYDVQLRWVTYASVLFATECDGKRTGGDQRHAKVISVDPPAYSPSNIDQEVILLVRRSYLWLFAECCRTNQGSVNPCDGALRPSLINQMHADKPSSSDI